MADENNFFKIRSYGFKELAILYGPEITSEAASKRLKSWLLKNEELCNELTRLGWTRRNRILTPVQVGVIIRYLGEP